MSVVVEEVEDRWLHEQRVTKPCVVRRVNHLFQHLYRHAGDTFNDRHLSLTNDGGGDGGGGGDRGGGSEQVVDGALLPSAKEYLMEYRGYGAEEVEGMARSFSPGSERGTAPRTQDAIS